MTVVQVVLVVAMAASSSVAIFVLAEALTASRHPPPTALPPPAEDRCQALADHLPVGVLVLDAAENVVLRNEVALALLGGAAPAAATLEQFTQVPEVLGCVRQAIRRHQAAAGVIARTSGSVVEVSAHPLPQGEALVMLRDVSELRLLRTVRRDFVANVSHELRTPLASIRLLVDTLEAGALEDAEVAGSFVHRIGVEADDLIQMVTELLELSRIESGQLPRKREPVAIPAAIERVVERLKVVAEDKGVHVSADAPAGLPPAWANEEEVGQILMNLLYNAVKFTPSGGTVRVRASFHDQSLAVSVEDTGVGIPREDLVRVFERFYKSDKSRARSSGGTGLGLPIARHIVEAHGGTIWVDSAEGKGSTFTFTLPRMNEELHHSPVRGTNE
ncbi:MAG TPA: ATP-binding protein [Chloroflexota bacterium]|nr:ATP-binding protein [Chloroflexota bacterium]